MYIQIDNTEHEINSIKQLKALCNDYPGYKQSIAEQVLQNLNSFVTDFADLLKFIKVFPEYEERIATLVLVAENFRVLVENSANNDCGELNELVEALPNHKTKIADLLLNPENFKKMFIFFERLQHFIELFPNYRQRVSELVFTDSTFESLFEMSFDILACAELFPEQHSRLIEFILSPNNLHILTSELDPFEDIVETLKEYKTRIAEFLLQANNFIVFAKSIDTLILLRDVFPECRQAIVACIETHHEHFKDLMEKSDDILEEYAREFPEASAFFAQLGGKDPRELQKTVATKVFREGNITAAQRLAINYPAEIFVDIRTAYPKLQFIAALLAVRLPIAHTTWEAANLEIEEAIARSQADALQTMLETRRRAGMLAAPNASDASASDTSDASEASRDTKRARYSAPPPKSPSSP